MKKSTKISLIVAASLTLIGCVMFTTAMSVNNWDFMKLSTVEYEDNSYEISESFDSISVITDVADVKFLPSSDGVCRVVSHESENERHSVEVVDGTLTVKLEDTGAWRENIAIMSFDYPKVTVYLPVGEYGTLTLLGSTGAVEIPEDFSFNEVDINVTTGYVKYSASVNGFLNIRAETGYVSIENLSCGELRVKTTAGMIKGANISCSGRVDLKVGTGKTTLANLHADSLYSRGDTGKLILTDVTAAGVMDISRDTGDVKFERCDAGEIYVRTDTGDVTGTLLSEKLFFVSTDTGKKRVPMTEGGGKCVIETDTGDIIITIAN